MITNRGRWILLFGVTGTTLGLLRTQESLTLVSVAVLLWLVFEWNLFRWRLCVVARGIRVSRLVNKNVRPPTLWMGRPAVVKIRLSMPGFGSLPFVRLHDLLPAGLEADREEAVRSVWVSPSGVEFSYRVTPVAAGHFVLPGVCARISDLQGLFYAQRFFECPQTVRVLPSVAAADAMPGLTKATNALLPPGMHRFLRAGSGPELLELREYMPGDPPKAIAWKVSARKNTLMTRQYESEVPVRVSLFVDGSARARVGIPGHRALDAVAGLAATLTKAVMAERDSVRLVRYSDTTADFGKYGAGEKQLFRILNALAEMSELSAFVPGPLTQRMLEQAWTFCEDRYPELLEPGVNRIPFTLTPVLPERRRWFRRRMQLAGVLAEIFGLPPDGTVRLTHDSARMAGCVYRLLSDAGVPWAEPAFSRFDGSADSGRLEVLANALTRAVGLARDNEVFVLISDLFDHAEELGPLRHAIRVARARHHRVVVIAPWPAPVDLRRLPHLDSDIAELIRKAQAIRLEDRAERLGATLRRMQVPFAAASPGRAVRLVLTEASLARAGRTTMAGRR